MDWKQFFASVIGSLAWPVVVVVLLYLGRDRIGDLIGRLVELSLPGGAKATFERKLENATDQIQELPQDVEGMPLPPPPPVAKDQPFLELAEKFPAAAVMEAFRELETIVLEIGELLRIKTRNPTKIIDELYRRKSIPESLVRLFNTLREARNAAAHAGNSDPITSGDAFQYRTQSSYLKGLLAVVLATLKMKNDRGPEKAGTS